MKKKKIMKKKMNMTMTRFNQMSLESLWRDHLSEKNANEAKVLFERGRKIAKDTVKNLSYSDAIKNNFLTPTNLAWYDYINRKSIHSDGNVVAIFANTKIEPSKYESPDGLPFGASGERGVYMMAKTLAKLGCNVYVFCDFDTKAEWQHTLPIKNPRYLPILRENSSHMMGPTSPGFILSFDDVLTRPTPHIDDLIVWCCTYTPDYCFESYAKRVHSWFINFNENPVCYYPDTIYALSRYHADYIIQKNPQYNPSDVIVGCMGIDTTSGEEVVKKKRRAKTCFYATSRIRGLLDLLKMWGDVLKAHPTATLTLGYGKQTFMSGTEVEMAQIDELIAKYKGSIIDLGMLPYEQLKKVMSQHSFYVYPYKTGDHMSETFSSMVAMAGRLGTIPIVRRRHGLIYTASPQEGDLLEEGEFLTRVNEMLAKTDDELIPYRKQWYDHCKQYTWENAAKVMIERFK